MVPCERSYHKEYTYEIFIFDGLKVMAKVKVFIFVYTPRRQGYDISSPDICPCSLKIMV